MNWSNSSSLLAIIWFTVSSSGTSSSSWRRHRRKQFRRALEEQKSSTWRFWCFTASRILLYTSWSAYFEIFTQSWRCSYHHPIIIKPCYHAQNCLHFLMIVRQISSKMSFLVAPRITFVWLWIILLQLIFWIRCFYWDLTKSVHGMTHLLIKQKQIPFKVVMTLFFNYFNTTRIPEMLGVFFFFY